MTKEWNEIEVTLPAMPGRKSKVVLNGTTLKDVRSVSLKSDVGEATEVTITLYAHVNYHPDGTDLGKQEIPTPPPPDVPMRKR